jgi:phosphatidylglycerol:prolipoprotein diacylglycerol transferase
MFGVVVGGWLADREVTRRGEKGERIWDLLVWVLPAGIIGARLWYVLNSILGGSSYYLDNPAQIINIPQGGLHFFGGLLFGAIVLYVYMRKYKLDFWLFLDAIAPAALLGQALARPANFINQELYGQPTDLPWGISIDAAHRLPIYANLSPATRFHPTFAYEMIWNILGTLLLLWLARQYVERLKPGTIFGGWLILAGVGRAIIEQFRPDQPLIAGTPISYSALVSMLMAAAGIVLLLIRYEKINPAFAQGWEQEYQVEQAQQPEVKEADTPA